jgi:hypothetical protein
MTIRRTAESNQREVRIRLDAGLAALRVSCTMISTQREHARTLRRHDAVSTPDAPGDPFAPPPLSPWRRAVYLTIAGVAFVVGMIGVVLPGLPTTPFLLVTSAFLLRSWPSMHERMLRTRLVGGLLSDWRRHRGVRLHVKIRAVALVVAVVAASIVLAGLSPLAATVAACCAAVGLAVIWALPTIRS